SPGRRRGLSRWSGFPSRGRGRGPHAGHGRPRRRAGGCVRRRCSCKRPTPARGARARPRRVRGTTVRRVAGRDRVRARRDTCSWWRVSAGDAGARGMEVGPRAIQVIVAPRQPCVAPEEVAAGLGPETAPERLFELTMQLRVVRLAFHGEVARAVDGGTGQVQAAERFFLRLRARPLHEFFAVVVVGVPGRRLHPDLAFGTVSIEVFVDEDRTNRRVAVAYGVHE